MKTKIKNFISRTASYSARLAVGFAIGLLACNGAYEGWNKLHIGYGAQAYDTKGLQAVVDMNTPIDQFETQYARGE